MEYNCKTIQLNTVLNGIANPLCDKCRSKDCSNPIEKMDVSVFGVIRSLRVYNRGMSPRLVISCDGFITK